jgi:hypothetical protein
VATASSDAEPVATFERPMYRPDDALGMMSVISAQSTARNMPAEAPKRSPPNSASGTSGAIAASPTPTDPITQLA